MNQSIFDDAIKKCEEDKSRHNKRAYGFGSGIAVWVALLLVSTILNYTAFSDLGNFFIVLPVLWSSVFFILVALYRMHVRLAEKQQVYIVGFMRARIAIVGFESNLHESMATALSESAFSEPEKSTKPHKPSKGVVEGHPVNDLTMTVFNRLMDNFELQVKQNKNDSKP